MANIHGKAAVIYLSPTAGAVAVAMGEQLDWSIDYEAPLVKTTPLNTTWETFVKGINGWSGTFAGNFDTASKALWTIGTDTGVANLYLYPQASVTGAYYYGTCWVIPGKLAAGSTTSKASSSFKVTGQGTLTSFP